MREPGYDIWKKDTDMGGYGCDDHTQFMITKNSSEHMSENVPIKNTLKTHKASEKKY